MLNGIPFDGDRARSAHPRARGMDGMVQPEGGGTGMGKTGGKSRSATGAPTRLSPVAADK
ncbi:hypothetical protein Sru01_20090 [Sphaerisporangium rufum]|uniref:Uncharacterized protein n=1 Tax=Sphaerisporangium rufum TaxID=1381558 RepID=A0A919QZU1_9ACTN|nr:hypothetical protein Sru01_20090 [Sphaerisporangium rufum]